MGDIDVELHLFDQREPEAVAEFDYETIARLTEEEFAERAIGEIEEIEESIPEEGEISIVFRPVDGESERQNWVSLNRDLPRSQELAFMVHDMLLEWRRDEDSPEAAWYEDNDEDREGFGNVQ